MFKDITGKPRPQGSGFDIGAYESEDTTALETAITSGPANPSGSTTASFSFRATPDESTFECQLDGTGFSGCSSPKTYNDLPDGSHTFQVRAQDAVGNPDSTPASFTWTVDTTAPMIWSVLASKIKKFSGTISWTTNEPADTQVEYGTTSVLVPSEFTPLIETRVLTHSQTLSNLVRKTTYYYRVMSRDPAGNQKVSDTSAFKTR